MAEAQAANALLTEHLRYTPLSLIDDIINSINNLIYQGVSSLEQGLLSQPPSRLGFKPGPLPPAAAASSLSSSTAPNPASADENELDNYPAAKLEIENGLHQLETLLENMVDKNFDKLEIYVLRNILTVPEDVVKWVRGSWYGDLSGLEDSQMASEERIQRLMLLRRKLLESQKLQRALLAEKARNERIIAELQAMLHGAASNGAAGKVEKGSDVVVPVDLSFLQANAKAGAATGSLKTNATFMLSQLPALRAMLDILKPRLASLPQAVEKFQADEKEMDRMEYIDHVARKNVGKLDGGRSETVLVQGLKRDKVEVEALEKLMTTRNQEEQ